MRRSIRIILNPNEHEILPATNYAIYCACRTVVSIAQKGEGLYDTLQMELEKCVGTLVRACTQNDKDKIEWISFFVTTCKWFETRIVSVLFASWLVHAYQKRLSRIYLSLCSRTWIKNILSATPVSNLFEQRQTRFSKKVSSAIRSSQTG